MEALRVYGISAVLCDALTSGDLIRVEEAGIAYVSYGPIFLLGENLAC